MNPKLKDALRTVFELTGAESLELHSGDREPGAYVRRADVMPQPPTPATKERATGARPNA